jgi:hypothetical protein
VLSTRCSALEWCKQCKQADLELCLDILCIWCQLLSPCRSPAVPHSAHRVAAAGCGCPVNMHEQRVAAHWRIRCSTCMRKARRSRDVAAGRCAAWGATDAVSARQDVCLTSASTTCAGVHPGRLRLQHGGQVERHPHGGDAGVRLAAQERGALQVHPSEPPCGCMLALL